MEHRIGEETTRVVWDWNGTLLDDVHHCIDVINELLAAYGLPGVDLHRYHEVFDFPVRRYYERLGFDLGGDQWEELAARFIRRYDQGVHRCALRVAAVPLLTKLHTRRVRNSILSAARAQSIEALLVRHEVRALLTDVVGLDDHFAGGKRERALAWLSENDVNPGSMLVIGDTTHDYEVARAMGARCVLVAGGHHSRRRLEACDCPVVDSLEQLVV